MPMFGSASSDGEGTAGHSALGGALRPIGKESIWYQEGTSSTRTRGDVVTDTDRERLLAAGLTEDSRRFALSCTILL